MIVTCSCGIKLKIGDEKITPAGIRVRCPKCGTTHLLKKPVEPELAVPSLDIAETPPPPAMPWFASSSQVSSSMPLILIAHDSKAVSDMINGVLQEAGMTTAYASNGLEALKKATDLKPRAMIVDVGLTGIYGFELCERLKSDPDTKDIKIILLSSVYGLTAYKRSPVTLYGADDYIEKHHIADQLIPKLSRLLSGEAAPGPEIPEVPQLDDQLPAAGPAAEVVPVSLSAPARPVTAPARTAPVAPPPEISDPEEMPDILPRTPITLGVSSRRSTIPASIPSVPPPDEQPLPVERPVEVTAAPPPLVSDAIEEADTAVKLDADFFEHEEYEAPEKPTPRVSVDPEEIEKARRFARIIVSDIALYSQDAVVEGIRDGTFYDLLKDDVSEGRALYEKRVPEAIRKTKDYLQEAFDDFIATKKKLR